MSDKGADDGKGAHAAINITFENLNFSVKDQRTGEAIQILKGVTGQCLSGRITAIMGSSGAGKCWSAASTARPPVAVPLALTHLDPPPPAGKTTLVRPSKRCFPRQRYAPFRCSRRRRRRLPLTPPAPSVQLDVLAGTNFGGTVEGQVLVNGARRLRSDFARLSCYVMQRDVLLASSTVREAVMFAALLKLPWRLPRAAKAARVDALLEELDLTGCRDTLIGDELLNMKGISGGQRRRVSVALELVKDPRVVFLDEPTSGLDSEMAVSLVVSCGRRRPLALFLRFPPLTKINLVPPYRCALSPWPLPWAAGDPGGAVAAGPHGSAHDPPAQQPDHQQL